MGPKSKKKRLLVITTSFAPENAIGSVRLVKFVKYLVRRGYQVTVISPELKPGTPRDEALECAELERVSRITVPQGKWFRRILARRRESFLSQRSATDLISSRRRHGLVGGLRTLLSRYIFFVFTMIRNWDWRCQVIRRIRGELEGQDFDVVISSYPSIGAMWVASWVRRKGRAGRWIADFRDPINYQRNSTAVTRRLNAILQNRLTSKADEVIAISSGVAHKLKDGGTNDNVHVISNGFDPDDSRDDSTAEASRGGQRPFQFVYVGSLYGGERDISIVFEAIRCLLEEPLYEGQQVEFVYAGNDFASLLDQATRFDLQSILVDRGSVSRQRAMEIQQRAQVAVVATWNSEEDQGIMTGKIFESFLLRKPVLGVVGGTKSGSEFKSVIGRVGAGLVYECAGDHEQQFVAIKSSIAEMIDQYSRNGVVAAEYNDAVMEFAYPNLVEKLERLFNLGES